MEIGTHLPTFSTGEHLVPETAIREWARGAERAGFDGLWVIDHMVKPHTYATSVLDPIVALTHAATVTETIDLGTGVVVLPLRRPAAVAKQALSLQHLAGRRLTLGVAAGYNRKEFEVAGVPIEERGPRLTEGIKVLQTLFEGRGTFEGRFHSFEDIPMDPVPETPPQILAGGGSRTDDAGERTMPEPIARRVFETDGWIVQPTAPEQVRAELELLGEHARAHGVDPEDVETTVLQYVHVVEDGDVESTQRRVFEGLFGQAGYDRAREHLLTGTVEDIRGQVRAFRDAGVDHLAVGPATTNADEFDDQLDRMAEVLLPLAD